MNRVGGFTLSELLIALLILGMIATFTIPKVLQSQASQHNIAVTKEAIASTVGALEAYKQANSLSASSGMTDLLPYLNYIRVVSNNSMSIDCPPNVGGCGSLQCNSGRPCAFLASGAAVFWETPNTFGNTASTNAVMFYVDPDGRRTSSNTPVEPSLGSIQLVLYTNGRVVQIGSTLPNTYDGTGVLPTLPSRDPSWFSWN